MGIKIVDSGRGWYAINTITLKRITNYYNTEAELVKLVNKFINKNRNK